MPLSPGYPYYGEQSCQLLDTRSPTVTRLHRKSSNSTKFMMAIEPNKTSSVLNCPHHGHFMSLSDNLRHNYKDISSANSVKSSQSLYIN